MAYTDINSEDRLVQQTFAEHLEGVLGWESVYAYKAETFGPDGTLGRKDAREVVLTRDLRAALVRLNPTLPAKAIDEAVAKMTRHDFSRSLLQHNQEFHGFIRDGVPVDYKDDKGQARSTRARVIDFDDVANNRFLAVRELCITGLRAPSYNRRADLVCFVNGIPLVFIELKAVYRNIRAGFDGNLSDYMDDHVVGHAFHHNAFLIVSNGDNARYGSITSGWDHFAEWKRNDERDKGKVKAEVLLDGMLAKDRLLDLVENFILFDASKAGKTRKVVARNHQVLGVNLAVESVKRQEELKRLFPVRRKVSYLEMKKGEWMYGTSRLTPEELNAPALVAEKALPQAEMPSSELALVQSAHPDLGRLGVFWHTQGSGKSYSMAFFAEKVRRKMPGAFTFVLMTDRDDLDDQIYRTFGGCGVIDPKKTPRASSGKELKKLLGENHAYVFTLIHKFNQEVTEPYSDRDDIIVISDEAHRTQAGKFARNMRLALPNAAFLGFTGTPLFKNDHLTKRIFGGYISRYDFKRSEEDGATVKLVYENRGEKLGITTLELNDRIAEAIEKAELSEDQRAHLDKLLGKDYEIITAPDRLEKIAKDFVEHCSARWESGKSMLVCIDKITCGRMFNLIRPHWQTKTAAVKAAAEAETDAAKKTKLFNKLKWLEETIIEIQISEEQGEVKAFKKWGVDTVRPIQLEDPKYGVVVPVRAFGQFGFCVNEPRKFLEKIVGTAKVFTATQITDYFKGVMLSSVNSNIGKAVVKQNISLLQISAFLDELGSFCKEKMAADFQQFGLEIINFYFHSINIPEEDPSLAKLKEIKTKAAELNIVGRDIYQLDKSMDVLKTAAGNEGLAGLMMQSGMGAGMGMMMGAQLGGQAGQMMTSLPPPLQGTASVMYYVALNGQQSGPYPLQILQQMIQTGTVNATSLVWFQGMSNWGAASSIPELAPLFAMPPPLPPPL
jgi:type I restriction enzyme R subunit